MTANPLAEATIEQTAKTNYVEQYKMINCLTQHKSIGYEP